MALGKKCKSFCAASRRGGLVGNGDEGLELGLVRYARAFGRKRIVISTNGGGDDFDSSPKTPLNKLRGRTDMALDSSSSSSSLEALPQDVLVSLQSLDFLQT